MQTWSCAGPLHTTDSDGITTHNAYDDNYQLIESTREATATTPTIATAYQRDAMGRVLKQIVSTGDLIQTTRNSYDILGRSLSSTDTLGRSTSTAYSSDGLTSTVTTPNGATLSNRSNLDDSIAEQSGTGQRHLRFAQRLESDLPTRIVTLSNNTILSKESSNGFGESVISKAPTTTAGIYITTSSEYNAKGQLIRQQSGSLAPTLYTYDNLGNQLKSTTLLDTSHPESVTSNRVNESESHYAQEADGIYSIITSTRYNAEGTALTRIQKSLISRLSRELESKVITINERSLTSIAETRYTDSLMERLVSSTVPTSDTVATATVVDGFTIEQSDHQGGNWSYTRSYNATGILSTQTDPRGITISTQTDIADRPIIQTDGEGSQTTTTYIACCNNPASITDALGNVIHYRYDIRNRKIAEYGTGIQPATYSYDDADRMTTLRTFRVDNSTITTDPTGRADGDTTTWTYHDATGLQLSKTNENSDIIIEDMPTSLTSMGVGAEISWRSKILVKIDGQNFFASGLPPQDGHKNPTGLYYIYKADNPKRQYRLDYHNLVDSGGKSVYHHNINRVKNFSFFKNVENHSEEGAEQLAKKLTLFKQGGRVLFVTGAAANAIEIYYAEDKKRAITKTVVGTISGIAGAYAGIKGGAVMGAYGGPKGAIIGGFIGGFIGQEVGETVTEDVYDYFFNKLEKEEYIICTNKMD